MFPCLIVIGLEKLLWRNVPNIEQVHRPTMGTQTKLHYGSAPLAIGEYIDATYGAIRFAMK
jgi:hypothetical protein